MSLAPRPVVLLLCCVALARVGALGNRKEGEAAEASADAVRMGSLALWPPGPSRGQVYRETRAVSV